MKEPTHFHQSPDINEGELTSLKSASTSDYEEEDVVHDKWDADGVSLFANTN